MLAQPVPGISDPDGQPERTITQTPAQYRPVDSRTQWHQGATCDTVARIPSPHPAARVAVDEHTWQEFRHAALLRGIPVSAYLAKLVEAELKRRKATPL